MRRDDGLVLPFLFLFHPTGGPLLSNFGCHFLLGFVFLFVLILYIDEMVWVCVEKMGWKGDDEGWEEEE
jgi:hypothetical protein